MKKVRVLSIDGGGIRGILPGTILKYVEEQLRKHDQNATIGKYFDFIAGTSTGGILSLIYLCPDDNGAFKYTANDALNIYLKNGPRIFDVSLKKKLSSMGGLLDETYDDKALQQSLHEYLGDEVLSNALLPCLITAYDMRNRKAHFFTSHDATSKIKDYFLKDVGRATSSAPTYFEPIQIKSLYGSQYTLIDGGVFANNPTLCAYSEARTIDFAAHFNSDEKPTYPGAKDMMIVSIGTGTVKKSYPYDDFKNANKIKWISPLIDIMMTGNAETVDYQLKQIFGTLDADNQNDYYRIQPSLNHANSEMDDASEKNIEALMNDGKLAVEENKELLDEIGGKLILNG